MKYIVTNGFHTEEPNPLSADGSYAGFSCFSTNGPSEYDLLTRRTTTGCWMVQFRKGNEHYKEALVDFVRYENQYGRTVIIDSDHEDIHDILQKGQIEHFLPKTLVHSTSYSVYESIMRDGKLIAPFFLPEQERWNYQHDRSDVDRYLDNEPDEYKQYVMLGTMEAKTELIMAMYQKKSFSIDENVRYEPGVRFYFDAYKMLNDGLIVFDGIHIAKVYQGIELDRYLMRAISYRELERTQPWTPKAFQECANRLFKESLEY